MDLERFRYYTEWHSEANRRAYDAPADPWALLSVPPADVSHYNDALRLNWGLGRVQGGDWDGDEHCRQMRETRLYRSLEQRFDHGGDWAETDLYRWARERFERGASVRGYDTLEEFREVRCAYIDELYRSIEQAGYQPNAAATHDPASDDNAFEDAYANHLDPLVAIGRSGEIYWLEGNHRFAIASLLDLEEIPVLVLARHDRWQAIRDRVAAPADAVPSTLDVSLEHPDLQDVRA